MYKKRILEQPPKGEVFIINRIVKNKKAMSCIKNFFKAVGVNLYKEKSEIFLYFNLNYFGHTCLMKQKRYDFWILSIDQIKSIVWIRKNYNELNKKHRGTQNKETMIDYLIGRLECFIKETKSVKDDCRYIQKKHIGVCGYD